MSGESLNHLVSGWANNSDRAERWCAELKESDIDDIHALEAMAGGRFWDMFVTQIAAKDTRLATVLDELKTKVYDKSNSLIW